MSDVISDKDKKEEDNTKIRKKKEKKECSPKCIEGYFILINT